MILQFLGSFPIWNEIFDIFVMNFNFYKKMLKAERHKYIMTKLIEDQKVVTTDLALALDLSEDTIRRDLNELDSRKQLEKVYGGAVQVKEKPANVFDIAITAEEQKKQIVTKALSLLHDDQVIIMSGGSTNLVFAKLIPADLKATIYTYSLPIAMQLSQHPNIDLIFIALIFGVTAILITKIYKPYERTRKEN